MKQDFLFILNEGIDSRQMRELYAVARVHSHRAEWDGYEVPSKLSIFCEAQRMIEYSRRFRIPPSVLGSARMRALERRAMTQYRRATSKVPPTRITDTMRLDWLEKNRALLNSPNTSGGLAHVAVGTLLPFVNHFYDQDYRAVIDRAIRETETGFGSTKPTRRSKRSA